MVDSPGLSACPLARRTFVLAAAAVLAGCDSGEGAPRAPAAGGTTPPATSPGSGEPAGRLTPVAGVPVGGAAAAEGGGVLVVQPRRGVFRAYDARCPHAGGLVRPPGTDGVAVCPIHGARFGAADGSVLSGPAPRGLMVIPVRVVDGYVVRA